MERETLERAAEILRAAPRIVALTGAGLSRPSGIPDFRSQEGLWSHHDPSEVASLGSFRADPRRFFAWFLPLLNAMESAAPNPAHHALAALERASRLRAVITQNIDSLHRRAGSREVLELHGHLRSATCVECGHQVPAAPVIRLMRLSQLPRCHCGGLLKPDIILFDELLPRGLYWLARRAAETCDALVVAGTSLEVFPACELPALARRAGAKVVIVNQSPTHFDAYADAVLRADVAEALPALAERAGGYNA
ncbi:MAG TPA: NAD-dependent deacylase [Roseiflexaceae bacterium]|nr:NAD-dependent deacylase [Roseiflexaceae bacterium]